MKELVVRDLGQPLRIRLKQRPPALRKKRVLQQEFHAPSRLRDPLFRILDIPHVKPHQVLQILPAAPSGQGVVTDKGDSLGRQALPADLQ
jgi:hypothetical protein